MVNESDKKWLAYAAKLAIKGRGRVHPNPMVGCVLVKENRLVGGGWHQEYGNNHAEVVATTNAQADTLGSTAYVTLEPCNHQGKTGPCICRFRTRSCSCWWSKKIKRSRHRSSWTSG